MSDKNVFAVKKLERIWLNLTYGCNYRCKWCYASQTRNPQMMSLQLAKKLLNKFSKLGARECILIGGEPTLYKELPEIVQFGKKIGYVFCLITNGSRLHDAVYLQKLIDSGLDHISVSTASFDPQKHDVIVGLKGAFTLKKRALKNLVKLQKKGKIKFNISCVMGEKDISFYKDYLSAADKLGIRSVDFLNCMDPINNKKRDTRFPSPVATAKLIEKLYSLEKKYPHLKIDYTFRLPLCLLRKDILDNLVKTERIYNLQSSLMFGIGLAVTPAGDVLPSSHWLQFPLTTIWAKQNTLKTSSQFIKDWNSKEIISFRKSLWHYSSSKCKSCPYWQNRCIGGDPLLKQIYNLPKLIAKYAKW